MLAALEPQLGVLEQRDRRLPDLDTPIQQLEDHPPRALRRGELELQPLPIARIPLDSLDLRQPLHARLRLARLRGLRAEALDEALHPLDLGLLLVDRLAERHLPRGLLAAPLVPGAREEATPAGLQLQDGRADGLEEPAVVRDQDDRRVESYKRLLQPLQRLDVEVVGGLVEQQDVRGGGERAGQRSARELTARERVEAAVEVVLAEAQPAGHRGCAVAPQVAAARLQPCLRTRVAGEQRLA